jgi:hypothetical protein
MHDAVHLIATHLEVTSRFGPMALNAEQAQQTAHCLRTTADAADQAAHAYNHICDFAEHQHDAIEELDETYDRLVWRFRAASIVWAASTIALSAVILFGR